MSRNSRHKRTHRTAPRKPATAWRFVGGPRDGETAKARGEQGADELWVVEQEVTESGRVVREASHHYLSDGVSRYIYQGEVESWQATATA